MEYCITRMADFLDAKFQADTFRHFTAINVRSFSSNISLMAEIKGINKRKHKNFDLAIPSLFLSNKNVWDSTAMQKLGSDEKI